MISVQGVDLFCGCGGVTHGFIKAGIQMRLGVDFEGTYQQTFEKNNQVPFLRKDIRQLEASEIINYLDDPSKAPLVVSSCAPCQPFSLKNKRRSRDSSVDPRIDLGFELIRLLRGLKSQGVVCSGIFLENVPEFSKSPVWLGVKEELLKLGYSVAYNVINCLDYGVPQSRRRFIAIAVLECGFLTMPMSTHGVGRLPVVTVGKAFSGLPRIDAGDACTKYPNHRARSLSQINLRRITAVPPNGGSRSAFPDDLILDCHRNFEGHNDVYGRMSFDLPAPTITTRCISITNGRYGHPVENRAISIREAARLQTFPDDFVFHGNSLEADARMIGNAVPVTVAAIFGEYLKSILFAGNEGFESSVFNNSCATERHPELSS